MLEHSCSNTIPALEKTTTTTAKPRHFLSLSLSLSLEQKASDTKGIMCSRGGFGCTTNGEKKKKRERGRGIDPNHFFPHIFFCVSLSLSLSLEFRVTNTLDPQKKRRKIFRVSPHNSERTPLTPTPLCCGGFVFCVVQTTLAKERERERRSREEEEETLDYVRIQNCVVVGKRTLVMMGLDYWKILSR